MSSTPQQEIRSRMEVLAEEIASLRGSLPNGWDYPLSAQHTKVAADIKVYEQELKSLVAANPNEARACIDLRFRQSIIRRQAQINALPGISDELLYDQLVQTITND